MKKDKIILLTEQSGSQIINEQKNQNDESSVQSFLRQKRKNSFEFKEQTKEEQIEEINFCDYCKKRIESKELLNNLQNKDFTNKIINEKKELNNFNFNSLNNILINNDDEEKKKNKFFFKYLKKCCATCIQKIIKNREISNINLSNNYSYNIEEELKVLKIILSKNNEVENKMKEIINDLDYFKEDKNINNNNKDINNINIKNILIENTDKLKQIKKDLENIIEKKNLIINENESLNKIDQIHNKETKNDILQDKENEQKEGFQISSQNILTYTSNLKSKSESTKRYAILTKGYIYESKYEKMKKNNLTQTFQYNSFNQFKNYIHNFPILINKIAVNDNGKNMKNNNNLINRLSDIKNLENNANIKKSKFNSMTIPVKYQSLEIEKQISKLKDSEMNKTLDYNKTKINNNGLNQNNNINNNKMDIGKFNDNNENNINNKNILLNYLLSSYQINQKLLNQINFRINPINNVINRINNQEFLNDILNLNKLDGNINNIQNPINNSLINPLINPIIENPTNLNSSNNQLNNTLNFYNSIQSLYSQNQALMNNNLNRINIANSFNYLNAISNNSLGDLKMFNNNNMIPTTFNNLNPSFDIKNISGINLTNPILIENMIKNDNNHKNEPMNNNNKEFISENKTQKTDKNKKDNIN